MSGDRYTKVVLTVIAVALVWLALGGSSLTPRVSAQGSGPQQGKRIPPAPLSFCDMRPIANLRHNDIHFSVGINTTDNRSLAIVTGERVNPGGPQLPKPVMVKLRLRDESVIEGMAQPQPSVASGGYVDRRYRFDAKRELTLASIFSVTIILSGESFEVFPW